MGFTPQLIDQCLEENTGKDFDAHVQWIIAIKEQEENPTSAPAPAQPSQVNIKCDICSKLFLTLDDANLHAFKTEHESFSESTDEYKPLTEEEKKVKMAELQDKLQKRRKERAEQEAKEDALNAKIQRESSKRFQEAAKANEERELQKAINERKREKLEELQAKQRVLKQIENDRLERQSRTQQSEGKSLNPVPVAVAPSSAPMAAGDSVNIRIRFKDSQTFSRSFKAEERLEAVFDWVRAENPGIGKFRLFNSYPRQEFPVENKGMTLRELDLVPSASLLVE